MFEPVNDLAARLPRPTWTGDPVNDRRAAEQHIANGRRLRNEAFRCMVHAVIAWFRVTAHRVAGSLVGMPSHQV